MTAGTGSPLPHLRPAASGRLVALAGIGALMFMTRLVAPGAGQAAEVALVFAVRTAPGLARLILLTAMTALRAG